MTKAQLAVLGFDEQIASMARPMMSAAQREQVVRLMAAAVPPRAKMMHVDEGRVAAARYLAAMLIACEHGATNARGNGLRRAFGA